MTENAWHTGVSECVPGTCDDKTILGQALIAAQQPVDEGGDIGNRERAVTVNISTCCADLAAAQQIIDQVGHIVDRDTAVMIDIARLAIMATVV